MRIYVTFNENQIHKINGVTFNDRCVACFTAKSPVDGRRLAKELFNEDYKFINAVSDFQWEITPDRFPDGIKMVKWNRLD